MNETIQNLYRQLQLNEVISNIRLTYDETTLTIHKGKKHLLIKYDKDYDLYNIHYVCERMGKRHEEKMQGLYVDSMRRIVDEKLKLNRLDPQTQGLINTLGGII